MYTSIQIYKMGTNPKRVLSIQSHVVSGCVGNKCAVLPLNRLGFEVDAVNSVQFSNHTGYSHFEGQVIDGKDLGSLISGLEVNDLLSGYSHVLTGYIGSVSMLESISKTVRKLKELNPDLIYVCDPVCGDDGRLYCSDDIPDAFAKVLLPLATIITPNQFEAELLTGTKISSIEDAVRVCRLLHDKGPTTVILSSLSLPEAKDTISILASVSSPNTSDVFKIDVERIDGYFTGTGDLFSALLLGYIDRYPNNFGRALEIAVSALQVVLKDTAEKAEQYLQENPTIEKGSAAWWRCRELRLVENQDALLNPPIPVNQRCRHIDNTI